MIQQPDSQPNTAEPAPDRFPMAALLALGSAYFVVGTASLSVIGLVLPIADGLGVSAPDIACLVTVLALTFALAAPTGQVLFNRVARIKLLCSGLVLMALALTAAALAPNYWTLFGARAVLGLGAAFVSPMCSAIGAGMVPLHQQGRAMGIVFGGLTVATVLGVPVSAFLGTVLGWRAVMVVIAVLTLASASAVLMLVRDNSVAGKTTFGHLFAALTEGRTSLTVLTTLLQMAALFCTYALIAPYMIHKFDISLETVSLGLLAYGSFGVLGNILAGRLSDRWGADRVILISLLGTGVVFLILQLSGGSLIIGLVIFSAWAVFGMMFHAPQQQRVANISVAQRSLLLALNASALYLGMSIGSWLSRVVSVRYGYDALPALSMMMLALCLVAFYASRRNLATSEELR